MENTLPPSHEQFDDLTAELLGVGSDLNSFVRTVSSPRQAMYGSHSSQNLIVDGASPNTIMSGAEPEYAKGTFMAKMPVTGMIVKVIPRFKATAGLVSISQGMNPETVVIYEDLAAREYGHYRLGMITLKSFHSVHPTFGFKYAHTAAQAELYPGNIIPEGTIFTHSPAVDTLGHYAYGIEANVAAISIPEIIEDGYVVSESFCEKLASWEIGSRQIRWGNKEYPLNMHGTDERFKIVPDIGESVGPTGLLAALRTRDDLFSVCDMTPEALRTLDSNYDRPIFVPPNSIITDIRIYRDDNPEQRTPTSMVEQMLVYENMQTTFYREIANTYRFHKSKSGGALTLTPELDRLVVEAMLEERSNVKGHHITKTYRAAPLEEWMIEVHYARKFIPGIRNKITGQYGNKGVVVAVWKDEDMPVDAWGNRADVIVDGDSTIKRQNPGWLYEHYTKAVMRMVNHRVRKQYRVKDMDAAWNEIITFYTIASPKMEHLVRTAIGDNNAARQRHIDYVAHHGIYLWLPTETTHVGTDMIRKLRDHYNLPLSPITYRGLSGKLVTTKNNVLIGGMYILLLEKVGDDWSAVASPKRQHFGLLSKLTNNDKNSKPWREQCVKFEGESEFRLITAMCGPEFANEIAEIANSPGVMREAVLSILRSQDPSNVGHVIDRSKLGGRSRALLFVKNMMECAGMVFRRKA